MMFDVEAARRIIADERRKSLSPREWKFRIAGYGYAVRPTTEGLMISSLPHGRDIGTLDPKYAA
ncbi:hypothetical protein SAMN04490248_101215 [Salinihabitans flavidus]|uniref:Uncharacterized protein n=1 Tax=Salinihabitans flavidus TaxID=569882 RepID=A0A1H8LMV0_9RHOB|nr:hypothetical protein [Salinihabitans flavidus]SEO06409.1 hypothetical protein SAMN04490248_101215 [Salinihabitans flavidus]